MRDTYVLDGEPFFDRPYFLDHDCHAWDVIGARHLDSDLGHQLHVRTERFAVPAIDLRRLLRDRYPALVAEAARRDYTAVWLLYSRDEQLVSIVAFTDRMSPANPDLAGLAALETAPPLGDNFADLGWPRTFDRTQFTLTIWQPHAPLDPPLDGQPRSLWPFSPPLPTPTNHDGVCVPSCGDNHQSAPEDCPPHCPDGVAQPAEGETTRNCPTDVPLAPGT